MTVGQTKLIGLLGGMSWESSALYYRLLNQVALHRLGGHHNARSLLFTLDFDVINDLAARGDWARVGELVSNAARSLERAGAWFLMITAVTAHVVADQVAAAVGVPLLHIADPTGEAIRAAGFSRVGLLATRYTMELGFLAERLTQRFGLDVIVPPEDQRSALHRIIIDELTQGIVSEPSRAALKGMAADLGARGAQAVVVACTELPLLLAIEDYPLPAFDVVRLHVEAAIDLALTED